MPVYTCVKKILELLWGFVWLQLGQLHIDKANNFTIRGPVRGPGHQRGGPDIGHRDLNGIPSEDVSGNWNFSGLL